MRGENGGYDKKTGTPRLHLFEGELPDEYNDTAVIYYTWMIAGIL